MKNVSKFILSRLIAGVLVLVPIYLAALLVLNAMKSLTRFVLPLAKLLPKWLPAAHLLSFVIVLIVCLLTGITVHTVKGRAIWNRIENSLFQKMPGYSLFQSLTQQLAGEAKGQTWKPALAEIADALVPAFIVEELDDGSFTVFVPSVPSSLAGSIYILRPERVHPLNVPFTHAIKVLSKWGSGSKELVSAMDSKQAPSSHRQLR